MSSGRTVIVDCGASRTTLGIFSLRGGQMRLDAFAVETAAFPTGGDENWLEHTRAALSRLRQRQKARGPVVLVLPAHLTLTKLIKVPRVAPAQREKIIHFEAEQNIPFALSDVVWDSRVVGETDSELEVLIAAAKLDVVESLCAAAEDAGFAVRQFLPAALATLAGFQLARPAGSECSLVLAHGVRSNTLLLVEAKGFALRTFSLGGTGLLPPLNDRDSAASIPVPDKPVAGADHPALPFRLAQEVTRSLLYFRSKGKTANPCALYLDANTAQISGLSESLTTRLRLPVQVYDVRKAIGYANETLRHDAAKQPDGLVDLVGAAAAQLRPGQPVVNLLPSARLNRVIARRRQPWLLVAAVLLLAALGLPAMHWQRLATEAQKQTVVIEGRLAPLRAREMRIRTKLQCLAELTQQLATLESLDARRSSWLELLAGLQDRLTQAEDVWLEKLQVVSPTAEGPLKLAISGCLLDKANPLSKVSPESHLRAKALLAGLAESPLVAAVEEERFDHHQPGILRFDCVLVTKAQRPL